VGPAERSKKVVSLFVALVDVHTNLDLFILRHRDVSFGRCNGD